MTQVHDVACVAQEIQMSYQQMWGEVARTTWVGVQETKDEPGERRC